MNLDVNNDQRIIIVGDIHGCLQTLQALLAKCQYEPTKDILISVGDIVNKGPDSAGVVNFFYTMSCTKNYSVYVVMGNNEEKVLDKSPVWFKKLAPEVRQYVRDFPYTITIHRTEDEPTQIIVVHAGLVPGIPLDQQQKFDLTHMRNLVVHDGLWKAIKDKDQGISWISQWNGPEFVVFGHDARRGMQIGEHVLGLDTGCVYGRELTAVIFSGVSGDGGYEIVEAKYCD